MHPDLAMDLKKCRYDVAGKSFGSCDKFLRLASSGAVFLVVYLGEYESSPLTCK